MTRRPFPHPMLAPLLVFALMSSLDSRAAGSLEAQAEAEWETNAVTGLSAPSVDWQFDWAGPLGTIGSVKVSAEDSEGAADVPLPCEADLRRRVLSIAAPAEDAALVQADWAAVAAALGSIRALPSPAAVRALETCLENLEASLDAFLAGLASADASQADLAWLLARAGELEQHADRLETTASRIRLYSKGAAAVALAAGLEDATKDLADGDRGAYLAGLRRLAALAEAARGGELRSDAADSIRSGCDTLIRRLAARTAKRTLDVSGSIEIQRLYLEADVAATRNAATAPSGGTDSLSAAGAVSCDFGDAELGVSFGGKRVDVDDRLRSSSAEVASEAEAFAECRLGDADFGARISVERERRPAQIDAEVEAADFDDVRPTADALAEEVAEAALPSATARLLLADLTALCEALDEGLGGEAADAIEDFVDHVESERWKGNLSEATAARWTERADAARPRRSVRRVDIPVAVSTPVGDGVLDVALEWSTATYPANAALSARKSARSATWSIERDGWDVEATAERAATRYPAAPAKDVTASQVALAFARRLGAGDFKLTASNARRVYPAAPTKDRTDSAAAASWSGEWVGLDLSLEASRKARSYPNDPTRLGTVTRSHELEAALSLSGASFDIAWQTENVMTSDGEPDSDASSMSLTCRHDRGGVELALSADWEIETDWLSPENDRRALHLTAEFAIPF